MGKRMKRKRDRERERKTRKEIHNYLCINGIVGLKPNE